MRAATLTFLSTGLAHARRDARAEILGKLLDAIDSALCAGEFMVIDIEADEVSNGNLIADIMVNLQNARDLAERLR